MFESKNSTFKFILIILLASFATQAKPLGHGTKSFLWCCAAMTSGIGSYLSYKHAKKLYNKLESKSINKNIIELIEKKILFSEALTGILAALSAISAFSAIKNFSNFFPNKDKDVFEEETEVLQESGAFFSIDRKNRSVKIRLNNGEESGERTISFEELEECKQKQLKKLRANGACKYQIKRIEYEIRNIKESIDFSEEEIEKFQESISFLENKIEDGKLNIKKLNQRISEVQNIRKAHEKSFANEELSEKEKFLFIIGSCL